MPTPIKTSIGISLGTRYIGTAVIISTELREWRLRVVRGDTLLEKFQIVTSILARLLERYAPTDVTIKRIHPSKCSPELDSMTIEMREYLQQHGVVLQQRTLNQVKMRLLPGRGVDKFGLIDFIVSEYPILGDEWKREQALKRSYKLVMFEAVALATENAREDNS